jgi:hypothetical protein
MSLPGASNVDYMRLGYLPVEGASKEFGKLTWTEALRNEQTGPDFTVYKDYYLGTESNKNFDKMHGCALFFSDVNPENAHYGPKDGKKPDDTKNDNGSCEAALSKDCANALLERAKKIPTTTNYCYNLLVSFENELDAACADFAKKDKYNGKWGSLQVKSEHYILPVSTCNFLRRESDQTQLYLTTVPPLFNIHKLKKRIQGRK